MPLDTLYNTGTASVGAGSTTVTGSGTAWNTAGLQAGDDFRANGLAVPIASVNSATSITLSRPWPGSALSGANYDIRLFDDANRSLAAFNILRQALGAGTLTSLAGLASGANLAPYWTGAGVMATMPVTAWGRSLLDDANVAAFWATVGASAGAAQAFRRGNILGTVSQSGGVPTGAIIERGSNANGEYVRFADGTQICTFLANPASVAVTTAAGSIFYNATEEVWTFPAAFSTSNNLYCAASARNSLPIWARARVTASSAAAVRVFSPTSLTSSMFIELIAIGRWF